MSIGFLALCAFIPILLALILMAGLRWPSTRAMPLSWLVGALIAWAVWDLEPMRLLALSIEGTITAIGVLIIVFGALLIYYTLHYNGAMETIQAGMKKISPDRRVQTIIIGFMFAAFIEGPRASARLPPLPRRCCWASASRPCAPRSSVWPSTACPRPSALSAPPCWPVSNRWKALPWRPPATAIPPGSTRSSVNTSL